MNVLDNQSAYKVVEGQGPYKQSGQWGFIMATLKFQILCP